MNENDSTIIEQKTTLPNPFDTFSDNRNNIHPMLSDRNCLSVPKIATFKDNSNDYIGNDSDVYLSNSRRKNPNFPPFFPMVYHSIGLEIPHKYSFIIRICYYCALSFSYVLMLTFFAELFSNHIDNLLIVRWRELILSFFILLVCPASLFYAQYFPLYHAIRDEKQNFSLIPFQFFTILFFFFIFLGIPGTGMIGICYFLICHKCGSIFTEILSFIITAWHFFNLVVEIIILFMIVPLNRQNSS